MHYLIEFLACYWAFQLRIKREVNEAALENHRKMVKLSSAYHAMLSAVESHGLRSFDFAVAFDKQVTLVSLSPVVTVAWPPHVLLSRHRLRIKAMRWFEWRLFMYYSKTYFTKMPRVCVFMSRVCVFIDPLSATA